MDSITTGGRCRTRPAQRPVVIFFPSDAQGDCAMSTFDTPRVSWNGIDPADWMLTWQAIWRGTPESLTQPILPGWTFNINSNNSSAPETEVEVVARHSYGRQL